MSDSERWKERKRPQVRNSRRDREANIFSTRQYSPIPDFQAKRKGKAGAGLREAIGGRRGGAKASPVSAAAGMPVTRRRAAAAATAARVVVQEVEDRDAAIEISSDSEAGSEWRSSAAAAEEDSESGEEVDTSDEDFVDISDSEAGDGEGSGEESEEESGAEAEQLGSDRSEAACNKIAGLLRST